MADESKSFNPDGEEEEKPDPKIFRPDLYEAALNNDTNKVLKLCDDGTPPTYIDPGTGLTALHYASMNGNIDMVKKLIQCGAAEPYHRALRKRAALEALAADNKVKNQNKSEEKKEEVPIENDGNKIEGENNENIGKNDANNNNVDPNTITKTEVTETKTSGTIDDDDDDSDEYVAEERKLEKTFPFYKNTPLQWAAFKGHKRVVWELLMEGYSTNDVDSCGNNAVHLAASNNLYKILKILLDDGGNANAPNLYRNTPLDLCTKRESRDLLTYEMEAGASLTDEDRKIKHEKNLKTFTTMVHNLQSTLTEGSQVESPRSGFKSYNRTSTLEYMKRLSDCINDSKEWGLDEQLIVQAENLLNRLELVQEVIADSIELQNNLPLKSQEDYNLYVNRCLKTINKAEAMDVDKSQLQFGYDLISRAQIEYRISTLIDRLKDCPCCKDANEHDMNTLKSSYQKGQALNADEKIIETASILYTRLNAELSMSRAIAGMPNVKLPPVGEVPPGYWEECDTGKIKETEEYPLPPADNNNEYIWEPSQSFASLKKAIEVLNASFDGAEAAGANPDVVAMAKDMLKKAEKDIKLLEVKDAADKVIGIDNATKLAKKLKKGKKK
jgi:ankyrin repeat protein